MPDNWSSYIKNENAFTSTRIPVLRMSQNFSCFAAELFEHSNLNVSLNNIIYDPLSFLSGDAIFYDSGQPIIVPYAKNNTIHFCILSILSFGGAGSGPSLAGLKSWINSAMTALGGGYQLEEADLSDYIAY